MLAEILSAIERGPLLNGWCVRELCHSCAHIFALCGHLISTKIAFQVRNFGYFQSGCIVCFLLLYKPSND
jgi:hypothetical protein